MDVRNAVYPTPDQFAAFFAGPDDGAFVMVNLLKFKPAATYADGADAQLTEAQAYARYAAAVTAMLAVALRYRTLTPLFLTLLALEHALLALQVFVLNPPAGGHHPPGRYGSLIAVPLTLLFLFLSLRPRRG